MRDFVKSIPQNLVRGFDDWEDIESSYEGVRLEVSYEDSEVELPSNLRQRANSLKSHVPDEDEKLASHIFNGSRYCLTNYESGLRGQGEVSMCKLYFKKSDYRNFLVTNGINERWATLSGLENEWGGNRKKTITIRFLSHAGYTQIYQNQAPANTELSFFIK